MELDEKFVSLYTKHVGVAPNGEEYYREEARQMMYESQNDVSNLMKFVAAVALKQEAIEQVLVKEYPSLVKKIDKAIRSLSRRSNVLSEAFNNNTKQVESNGNMGSN